ncbi:hypothetical protein EVAR_31202_1 [Eumeta japonica]|uniref:Uncharacterized protein n=1 Tax=Eumeta variegata TaxID=151549 RepID=A0A4C1VVX3_EUMVA|nr:hypothetical protein EVAR_31202_1 [Eumeta japonica]
MNLKIDDNNIVLSKPEISEKIKNFYHKLYTSSKPVIRTESQKSSSKADWILHRGTEGISDVSLYEMKLALKQMLYPHPLIGENCPRKAGDILVTDRPISGRRQGAPASPRERVKNDPPFAELVSCRRVHR